MAPYGDYWKFMKKLIVTKLLGPQALMRLQEARADELERFHSSLLDKAMNKETVEIAKEAIKLTNNSICKMIMGRSCSEENGEAEIIRGLIAETFALFKKLFVARLFRVPLFKKEMMSVTRRFDELLERILAEHEEKPDFHHGADIMNMLLEAYHDENAEYKITREHIKSLAVELILGGTDSSALTIEWIMAEIINNPNVFERLPYLQAVVKEGLRLHPPVPIFTRMLLKECKIGDYHVPKNTSLIVNSYAVMRDPDFWDDPEEFEPERFLASSKSGQEEEREKALKFLPFGSGRRGCPGANLAYTFIGTAIGVMVQCFDWEIKEDKVNMEETLSGMTVSMAHPLSCLPVART